VQFDRLHAGAIDAFPKMSQWDRRAAQSQIESLIDTQIGVVRRLIETGKTAEEFLSERSGRAANLTANLKSLGLGKQWSFSKFSLAADHVRKFLN
ncbi:MAG: hypothetical protein AAF683_15205, partial [Pseudomonadota bacterium]